MTLPRRTFVRLAAGAVAAPAISRFAWAAPSRPVRIVVGFAPAAQPTSLRACWPDRCRNGLVRNLSSITVRYRRQYRHRGRRERGARRPYAAHGRSLRRDRRDALRQARLQFPPRHRAGRRCRLSPNVMLVGPSVTAKTVVEFIALAKADPGKLTMASAGVGTASHLAGELFKMMTGAEMVHVAYRGGAGAYVCRSHRRPGGRLLPGAASSLDHIRYGRLRALAVTAPRRQLDLPTIGEFVPGLRPTPGLASAHHGTRPPTSSSGSTLRSTPSWPIPRSRRGSPISAARSSPAQRPTSAS